MKPLSVVICQSDSRVARALASCLTGHFHSVRVATSLDELRETILRYRADALVLDMELAQLEQIRRLHTEFPRLCIVATHRLADEEMWAAALNVGASDICQSMDTQAILYSAIHNVHGTGAAA